MMKAVCLEDFTDTAAIYVRELPQPVPAAGELLVSVRAAGVTPTELGWVLSRRNRDGTPRPLPVIPGHEFSGIVAAVGPGIVGAQVGNPVYGMTDWFADGTHAEYCIAPAAWVAPKPKSLDYAAASVVPISALTAWQGLVLRCRVAAGQRVLVHGGAGSVGGFAVQLARWLGARVIATASEHNLDFVRSLGADEVINHHTTRFEDVASNMDVIFDTVGGETLARSWGLLRPSGQLVTIAASEEQSVDARDRAAFLLVQPDQAQLANITRLIDAGDLRPVVDVVFPLADVRHAYEHKPVRGKAILRINTDGPETPKIWASGAASIHNQNEGTS
jgi:NADPH:quinone reductase-like Zn-dependent oxidoreductase